MAERKPKKTQTVPTPGVPVQYRDLDRVGQRVLDSKARDIGRGVKARVNAAADRMENSTAKKAGKAVEDLRTIAKHSRNVDTSIDAMAGRRVDLVEGGMQRTVSEGTSAGDGWYYQHHAEIAASARPHGVHPDAAITAAALMSPQNSPTNERAAVKAIMHQQSGGAMTPDVEKDLRRAGTKVNLGRASEYLAEHGRTGDISNPINIHTAAKIGNYAENTKAAVPNSAEHNEYLTRVGKMKDSATGVVHRDQGQLDLWGLQDSRQGTLNPEGNTVEDTWMNSISMGQDFGTTVGRLNIGKAYGSAKQLEYGSFGVRDSRGNSAGMPGVNANSLLHAVNNEATIRAADTLSQRHGVVDSQGRSALPSMAVQEMAWTEVRRTAGKDPEYTQHQEAASRQASAEAGVAKRTLSNQKKQQPLF